MKKQTRKKDATAKARVARPTTDRTARKPSQPRKSTTWPKVRRQVEAALHPPTKIKGRAGKAGQAGSGQAGRLRAGSGQAQGRQAGSGQAGSGQAQAGSGQAGKALDQPQYSAPWRSGIDWVAAGKKAYETRMKNLAAKATGTPAAAPIKAAIAAIERGEGITLPKRRKAPTPAPAPLSEGDTSGH